MTSPDTVKFRALRVAHCLLLFLYFGRLKQAALGSDCPAPVGKPFSVSAVSRGTRNPQKPTLSFAVLASVLPWDTHWPSLPTGKILNGANQRESSTSGLGGRAEHGRAA